MFEIKVFISTNTIQQNIMAIPCPTAAGLMVELQKLLLNTTMYTDNVEVYFVIKQTKK